MGDTSSDDELPLAQRPLGGILLAGRAAAACVKSGGGSESESDMPSWLQAPGGAKGKGNQVISLTDSSDDDAVLSPPKPAAKPAAAAAAAAEPAGNRGGAEAQPASQAQAAAAPKSAAKARATPGRARGTAPAAAAGAGAGDDAAGTQAPASQAPKPRPLAGLPSVSTASMAVMLPEKLPQMKMLVELEAGGSDDVHGVTDLSGDSGAIGRLIIGGSKAEPQMQIDLKGVLYHAAIVPCPVSLAVINMGQSEAKVECLLTEFVQLREDTRFSFVDLDQLGGLVGDDDDNYTGGGEGEGTTATKGRGKKAAAGGGAKAAAGKAAAGKAAPRKRAAPKAKKGGVAKKPRAKAAAKPKAAAKAKK